MLFVFESAVSDLVEPALRIGTGSSVDAYIKLHSQQQNIGITVNTPRVIIVIRRVHRRRRLLSRMNLIVPQAFVIFLLVTDLESTSCRQFTFGHHFCHFLSLVRIDNDCSFSARIAFLKHVVNGTRHGILPITFAQSALLGTSRVNNVTTTQRTCKPKPFAGVIAGITYLKDRFRTPFSVFHP